MTLYCKPCNYEPDEEDLIDGKCDVCGGDVETVPLIEMERVARISKPGETPLYSPFGYVIGEDATVYALSEQYTHGVILALLYPDIAHEQDMEPPNEHFDVFAYQRFELDNHERFPVIRIAAGLMGLNISWGDASISVDQVMALTRCLTEMGINLNVEINTDSGMMTGRRLLKELRNGS